VVLTNQLKLQADSGDRRGGGGGGGGGGREGGDSGDRRGQVVTRGLLHAWLTYIRAAGSYWRSRSYCCLEVQTLTTYRLFLPSAALLL
jgi:hypothetical protein